MVKRISNKFQNADLQLKQQISTTFEILPERIRQTVELFVNEKS